MKFERIDGPCRAGIATTEVLGILVSICLGIAVGVAYKVIPSDTPASPPPTVAVEAPATPPAAPAVDTSAVVADEIRQLKQELLAELREKVPAPQQAPSAAPQQIRSNSSAEMNAAAERELFEKGQRTLAYWTQLNDIMAREEQMRNVPLGGLTAANARDFLHRRGQAGKFAADAIHALPGRGVDAEVIGIAADIATWYDRGTENNGMASFLLSKADSSARQGQSGQQWEESEKQHHASVDDINRRGDEVRRRMIEKYGLPFPDLR
jgi:hypothetical protein